MSSSAGPPPVSYRSNVNRAITKRWAEAKQISYEGNDWGDDDDYNEPSSARSAPQSNWPAQNAPGPRYGVPPIQQGPGNANRSFTNPSPTRSHGRPSFDQGDERRNFSAHTHTPSFEGPYPNAAPAPFPEPQHDVTESYHQPPARPPYGQPPLQVQTQSRPSSRDHAQYMRLPSTADVRGAPMQEPRGSAIQDPRGISVQDPSGGRPGYGQVEPPGRRSQSSGRPSQTDLYGRAESPYRTANHPPSARSHTSHDESPARRFPPRKSSLSQDTPLIDSNLQSSSSGLGGDPVAPSENTEVKALPFIRPADIYKRFQEEREKERISQESSRQSLDSNASRPRDIFTSARQSQESTRPNIDVDPTSSLVKSTEDPEDQEVTPRRLKPTLDPVVERKSEYGLDNILQQAGSGVPQKEAPSTPTSETPEPLSAASGRSEINPLTTMPTASSVYSQRSEPATTSPIASNRSLPPLPYSLPAFRGISDFGTDFLNQGPTARDNQSTITQPTTVMPDVNYASKALPTFPTSVLPQPQVRAVGPIPSAAGGIRGPPTSSATAMPDVNYGSKSLPPFPTSVLPQSQDAVSAGTPTATEQTGMHHNPSTGLRSVVHKAFDDSQEVPETPTSVADSVVRSNSATTSEISPIISRDLLPVATMPQIAQRDVRQPQSHANAVDPRVQTKGAPPLIMAAVPIHHANAVDPRVQTRGAPPAIMAAVPTFHSDALDLHARNGAPPISTSMAQSHSRMVDPRIQNKAPPIITTVAQSQLRAVDPRLSNDAPPMIAMQPKSHANAVDPRIQQSSPAPPIIAFRPQSHETAVDPRMRHAVAAPSTFATITQSHARAVDPRLGTEAPPMMANVAQSHANAADPRFQSEAHSPPATTSEPRTLQEIAQSIAQPSLPAPVPLLKTGYRRDTSLPSPGNSPARAPISVATSEARRAELGSVSDASPLDVQRPWASQRTTSEDWEEWEAQKRAFKAKAGLNESPLSTPGAALMAQADPPPRGIVRELTDKLETRSGRASPAISLTGLEAPRPSNARVESFRPSLPGGWQSYSTNADIPAAQETLAPLSRKAADSPVSAEDDDIPTAGPPRLRRKESDHGPSRTAFAAAAAAGSALAGAFTAVTGIESSKETPASHEAGEVERPAGGSVSHDVASRDSTPSRDPDSVTATRTAQVAPATNSLAPSAPTPPPSDTPDEEFDAPQSTLSYFPSPLRTSRTNDSPMASRPPLLSGLSSEISPQDTENDRLRKEIVQSLTPKASRYGEDMERESVDTFPVPTAPTLRQVEVSPPEQHIPTQNYGSIYQDTPTKTDRSVTLNAVNPQSTSDNTLSQPGMLAHEQPHVEAFRPTETATNRFSQHQAPHLEQRFSWERPKEAITPTASALALSETTSTPPIAQRSPEDAESPATIRPVAPSAQEQATVASCTVPVTAAANTIRQVPDDSSAGLGLNDRINGDQAHISSADEVSPSRDSGFHTNAGSLPSATGSRELPFREILSIESPQERIQAYNSSRGMIANTDTGLEEWLRSMGNHSPEHAELIRSNGRLSARDAETMASLKPSPARSKFQRIASLANTHQSTNSNIDEPRDYVNSPARSNNSQMQGQGKKLLQSAGKFGGQAGGAAKGLFAKGKSKLLAGGSSGDKGLHANRRRSSQPMIVVDEPQHSSVTATAAPQIPTLSPLETDEPWSLSYTPAESITKPSALERSVSPVHVQSNHVRNGESLSLPHHAHGTVDANRPSSPGISAIGSVHDGDLPSRSISEVTRPGNSGDERSPNIVPEAGQLPPSAVTGGLAADGTRSPRLVTALPTESAALAPARSPVRSPSAPVSDALGPLQPSRLTDRDGMSWPGSSAAERGFAPTGGLPSKPVDQETTSDALAASTSEIPQKAYSRNAPPSGHSALPTANHLPRASDSFAQPGALDMSAQHTNRAPSQDIASPPYVGHILSKEAEAAAERSQLHSAGQSLDGLPAYQTIGQEPHRAVGAHVGLDQPIIPVADLSNRRRYDNAPPQSRPFSFVGGNTLITPIGRSPAEGTTQALDVQQDRPDVDPLAKELSIASPGEGRNSMDLVKRRSKSYSRPFVTDPNVTDHPAYRESQEMTRNKDTEVPDQFDNTEQSNTRPLQTSSQGAQYRIPGPYVQEYRSPKQVPAAFANQQTPVVQTSPNDQFNQHSSPGLDPLRSHDPHAGDRTDSSFTADPRNARPTTGGALAEKSSKGGMFRSRSKSRSIKSRTDDSIVAGNKKDQRTGFFRSRSKTDNVSLRSGLGSMRGNSAGSRDALTSQISRDNVGSPNTYEQSAAQAGGVESTRPPMMLRKSEIDARKKRFSGFGGFFGRASAADTKKETMNSAGQPVQRSSTFSHYLLGKPDPRPQPRQTPSESLYAQNQDRQQALAAQNNPQTTPASHAAQQAPLGGYYSPEEQNAGQSPNMPDNPDSFIRGQHPANQQVSNPYHNQLSTNGLSGSYPSNTQRFMGQQPQQDFEQTQPRPPLHIDTTEQSTQHSPTHHFMTAPPGPAPQLPFQAQPQSTVSHVIDLHKRSRSPRNGRKFSADDREGVVDKNDPAAQLGTFSKSEKPRSGGSDGQEAPWRIGLPPGSEEEEVKRRSAALLLERNSRQENGVGAERENADEEEPLFPRKEQWQGQQQAHPTVAEQVMGAQAARAPLPVLQRNKNDGNARPWMGSGPNQASPVELPGSRAPGDDSDDEIVMSSTAYPGQEWMPEMGGYGQWDE